MNKLPVREIVLYKHGVGFFVREGDTDAQEVQLSFRPEEINDVLKSLTVFDRAGGRITGIYYQTPVDKEARLAESSLNLSDFGSLRDLLRDLRGRAISISYIESDKNKTLVGRIIGIESQNKGTEKITLLANDGQVRVLPFDDLRSFRVTDEQASSDLGYFLDNSITEENRRTVSVRLTEGNHQLVVYYIAPSPTWRVSYRIVAQADKDAQTGKGILQGWGVFDNRLDEDLENIRLTLIAGQPISFVYDLYNSHIPERPIIKDEERTAPVPMEFGQNYPRVSADDASLFRAESSVPSGLMSKRRGVLASTSVGMGGASIAVDTQSKDMGELFQYLVMTPVSVKRGESALVPILSANLQYERELLYNRAKLANNPVVAVRFDNTSGLTLERGPVTVVEDGTYKGEAIIPFTKANTEVYVPYAVELNIRVKESASLEMRFAGLKFENGFVVEQQYAVQTTRYTIENLTDKAQTLTLEIDNPLNQQVELFETPVPTTQTLNELRWKIALPQKGLITWQYKTRQMNANRIAIRQLSYKKLQEYLDGKYLDSATQTRLKEVLDTLALIETLKRKQTKSEDDKTALFRQNDEWRKSLDVLKGGTGGDAFQARLLKQLEESEDRLSLMNRDMRATDAKISACEKRIQTIIDELPSGS